jgi:hypothetical protein
MSDLSNYAEGKLVEHLLRNVAFTAPATVYLRLWTAVTNAEAGTGTEVSGGGYTGQAITFGAHSDGAVANTGAVSFTASGANYGTVTHASIADAATAGNQLSTIKALAASRVVNDGDTLTFAIGDIDFVLA